MTELPRGSNQQAVNGVAGSKLRRAHEIVAAPLYNQRMSTIEPDHPMRRLCAPSSIAVIGASEDRGKFGGRVMHQLQRHGFAGTLYPVNPHRKVINGLEAFACVADIPCPPDVAIIAVPPAVLLASIEDCVAGGVGVAIVITGNLASDNDNGEVLTQAIVHTARRGGMRVLGPNCLGIIAPADAVALSPSVTMAVDHLPLGPVGIASQSGALMTAMFMRGYDANIGFSCCISVGNQADLELCDAFEHLIADPHTSAICLYVEGIKDLARFRFSAELARTAGKPVVAVKAGRTASGASMAASHTGALAGSYATFCALAERHGIIVSDDAQSAVLIAQALALFGAARADGLAVLSSSGGAAVLASDAVADDSTLKVATLSEHTQAALAAFTQQPLQHALIDFGGYRRPFVLDEIAASLRALAIDPNVGAMVYVMTPQPLMDDVAMLLADVSEQHHIPIIVVSTAGSVARSAHEILRARNMVVHTHFDDALRVLRGLVHYRHSCAAFPCPEITVDMTAIRAACDGFATGLLNESQAKRLVASVGVAVPPEQLARDRSSAAAHAERMGYPVVLKVAATGVVHKSDCGGVALALDNRQSVERAFDHIKDALARHAPQATFHGTLVQPMVTGAVAELFVGAKYDPQHGPMVLVGAGGVLVELLDDIVVMAAPVAEAQARQAIERLKCYPVLKGYRDRPMADIQALATCVTQVSLLAHALGPQLAELDLNPVVVFAPGDGVCALDARGVWHRNGESQ